MPAELFTTPDQPLLIAAVPVLLTLTLAAMSWGIRRWLQNKDSSEELLEYYCERCGETWADEATPDGHRHCPFCDNACEGHPLEDDAC